MAKILCAYSGVLFNVDHFPISLTQRESHHPVFDIPQRKLLPLVQKWSAGELTSIDSYLLFLATLKSSELVNFRYPAIRTPKTDSIIAQNMEYLFKTVIKLNTVASPVSIFSSFVVSTDTRDLENVHYWIENWEEAYNDFQNGSRRDYDNRKLVQREAALEKLIKSPYRDVSQYAPQLADWAAVAGSFPTFILQSPFSTKPVSCTDYWKEIIIKATKSVALFSIPKKDIEELLDHCLENISAVGSVQAHLLFKVLRAAIAKQTNFLGLGDLDIGKSTYYVLEESKDVEHLNLKLVIDAAPIEKPTREQYPSNFQFLKAKMRWEMSQKYGSAHQSPPVDSSKREGDE